MKPDWRDAPEWAYYLAQDSDSSWYWYTDKPESADGCWVGVWFQRAEVPNTSWDKSLERRPAT